MRNIWKDLLKSTIISIGVAMSIFCIVGIVFDVRYGGNFNLENYRFTKMVLACIGIGLGFGIPSIVYRMDNLPMSLRVIIHMGIGLVIYTIIAYYVGWIGGTATVGQGIIIAAIQIGIAFIIWFFFLKHYKKEAEEINKKIQSLNN